MKPKTAGIFLATAALIAIVLVGLLAGTAQARPWTRHSQRVVSGEVSSWVSNQTFAPSEVLSMTIYVDGHGLPGHPGCSVAEAGHGVVVVLSVCGSDYAPLRVRAISLDGQPHKVTVVYKRIEYRFYR